VSVAEVARVLQIADHGRGSQVRVARWDQGLMHVKGVGEAAAGAPEANSGLRQIEGSVPGHGLSNGTLRGGEIRRPVYHCAKLFF
jgi:hypothetical protein